MKTKFARAVFFCLLAGSFSAWADSSAEPVNGLSVVMKPAASTWKLDEAMAFAVTLQNVSDKPFLIDTFGDLGEVYEGKHKSTPVLSCWALYWGGKTLGPAGPRRGKYTLHESQFVRLAPGESYTRQLSFTLSGFPPGTYPVQLAYVPRTATASFSLPNHWQDQKNLKDPMWMGMAFSNAVTMTVVPKAKEAL